jgi:hypothetical protein
MNHTESSRFYQVVVCRAREGASPERVAQLAQTLQAWVVRQPGFVERRLLVDPSTGTYVDLVGWRDRASADRAAAAPGHPSPDEMARLLDVEGMTVLDAVAVPLG